MTDPESRPNDISRRHLNFANLDAFWANGLAMELPVPGNPVCRLRLDPIRDLMSLRTPLVGAEADVTRYRNIDALAFTEDGEDWSEIRVAVGGAVHGVFGVLASIADRMQMNGDSLAAAVPRALAEYRDVFAARVGLTPAREIGLYGELIVVEFLLSHKHPGQAVEAWLGPLAEEHDFVLNEGNLEVKTTTSEDRRHMISGVHQLEPVSGRSLWLISLQLTRSSPGSGRTLHQLVEQVRFTATGARALLDRKLQLAGWQDDAADLYVIPWTLRSRPRCYQVNAHFPALTEANLIAAAPLAALITDVSYRVNVSTLPFTEGPTDLVGFVEITEEIHDDHF